MDRIWRLTREIVVSDSVIPFPALRSAMALGAADVVHSWLEQHGSEAHELSEVEARLRRAGKDASPEGAEGWTSGGRRALTEIAAAVRADAPVKVKGGPAATLIVSAYAGVVEKQFATEHARAQEHFRAGEMEEAREIFRALLEEAEELVASDPAHAQAMQQWAERFRLDVAACTINLQEIEQGVSLLRQVDAETLLPEGRIVLAAAFAQTGDVARARAVLPDTADGAPVGLDRSRLEETRQLISIGEGEIPGELHPTSSAVRLAAAHLLHEREDFERAAVLAQEALALALEKGRSLTAANAVSLLIVMLHGTIREEPPSAKLISPARREETVQAIERGVAAIQPSKLPAVVRRSFAEQERRYRLLTRDLDALPEGISDADESIARERESAEQLAHTGQLADVSPPWRAHYLRARLMAVAGQGKQALAELSGISGKAPVEYLRADLLLQERRAEEALVHATLAVELLPGKGYRLLHGRALLAAGRALEAWNVLQSFIGTRKPKILALLARAAEIARPSEAPALWQRYLAERPEDGHARVLLAQSLFKLRDAEEAAKVAWEAFQKHGEQLDAVSIYNCGLLQRLRGDPDDRSRRRVKEAAEMLRQRFLGDAEAEGLRFQLLRTVGAEEGEPIDMGLVAQSGVIEVLPAAEGVRRLLLLHDRSQAIDRLYRSGALPFVDRCRRTGASLAEAVVHVTRGGSNQSSLFSGPVSLADTAPLLRLEGCQLLMSDLELLLLQEVGMLDRMRAALGATGRLMLTVGASQRIIHESVNLGALVDPSELEKKKMLVDLIEGKGDLAAPISIQSEEERRIRSERERLAQEVRAARLVTKVHDFLRQGMTEGWIQDAPVPADTPDLPPLRSPQDGVDPGLLHELVEVPLQEMLAVRRVMEANPDCWRVTADFFGSGTLGHPATFGRLAWDREKYLDLSTWNRTLAQRDIHLPALVRLLAAPAALAEPLLRLAELGFVDALGADELLRLLRRPSKEAEAVLNGMEWMARDPEHIGASYAHLRVVGVYAEAIWQSFAEPTSLGEVEEGGVAATEEITRFLLLRLEAIDDRMGTATLERALSFIGLKTVERCSAFYVPVEERQVFFSEESRAAALWRFVTAWAREDVRRRAAYGRAVREVWRVLDELEPDGPARVRSKPLTLAFDIVEHQAGLVDLTEPELEAAAILSAHWRDRPLTEVGLEVTNPKDGASVQFNLEQVLAHGASLLGESSEIGGDDATWRYPYLVAGLPEPLDAYVPPEAVLLRTKTSTRQAAAEEWASVQGPQDGRLYELLSGIAERPEEVSLQREYARRASTALFRLVREEPEFLRIWPRRQSLSGGSRQPNITDLRQILSEPDGPLPADISIEDELIGRMQPGGAWSKRGDGPTLFLRAVEIPGSLPAAALGSRLAEPGYAAQVEIALERLEHAEEHPAPRLAGDLIFLRVAAAEKPHVRLSRGETDLREHLPSKIVQLLASLLGEGVSLDADAPKRPRAIPVPEGTSITTMAVAEAPLLRMCAKVVNELVSRSEATLPRERLWLTYRLFQWLWAQLERLGFSARREALARLVKSAPPPGGEPTDLLDPSHFARDRFDHRLATVIHALAAGEEVARRSPPGGPGPEAPYRLSSQALESKLATIAEQPCSGEEHMSRLAWHAVGHLPDLALVTLLRLNSEGLLLLSTAARLRRIEALPFEPDREPPPRRSFTEALMSSISDHVGRLEAEERDAFERKLRSMDGTSTSARYRWIGFTCLFGAGAAHLEAEAKSLLLAHLKVDPLASMMFGRLLLGIGAADPSRLQPEAEALLDATTAAGASPDPGPGIVASGLGRVALHGSPAARRSARLALAQLARRPELREDRDFIALLRYLDIPEAIA